MREARITAGLHHPHAVTVFDVVEHEGQPCIVMQLIESTPLSDLLSEHGTLTPPETARIGAQVGSALAAAHRMRIVHRDVKPGNILITEDGSAMISDFGISHALGDTTITATGLIHGTPAYLAPEVARGLPTSFASDVFSLGSTLYAMLEGAPPFGTENNAIALLHKVARGGYPSPTHAGPLAPLLRSMLAGNPKRRPSMESVVQSLTVIPDQSRASAAPVGLPWPFGGPRDADTGATEPLSETAPGATEPLSETAPGATEPLSVSAPTAATVAMDPPTRPAPATPEPTAETERFAQPAPAESRTAETEPLSGGVPLRPQHAGQAPQPSPEPSRRGRPAAVVVGLLSIIGILVVGALVLWNPWGSTVDQVAEPRSAAPSPAATGTPTSPAAPSAAETTAPPADAAAPAPPTPEQRAVETVTGYYAMLPDDLDGAWPLMTADYQENHAGGRGGYESFWGFVDGVEVADVSAPAADQAQATLTYYFSDGRVVQEVTLYRLVDEGGVLKIAASDVLSSTEL